jgi:hypothetical protein
MKELYKISLPLYHAAIHVFLGTREDCAEAMRKVGVKEREIEEWLDDTNGYEGMYHQEDDFRLIWLQEVPTTVGKYSDLVHEIEHATFYLLKSRGLQHTEESDEAYAYLSGYIFEQIDSLIVSLRDEKEENCDNTPVVR